MGHRSEQRKSGVAFRGRDRTGGNGVAGHQLQRLAGEGEARGIGAFRHEAGSLAAGHAQTGLAEQAGEAGTDGVAPHARRFGGLERAADHPAEEVGAGLAGIGRRSGVHVGFLHEQDPGGREAAGEGAQHGEGITQVHQQETAVDPIEPLPAEHRGSGDVEPADLVARIGGIEKAGIQVNGDHGRARELGQQAGDTSASGTHQKASLSLADAGSEQAPVSDGIPGELQALETQLLVLGRRSVDTWAAK